MNYLREVEQEYEELANTEIEGPEKMKKFLYMTLAQETRQKKIDELNLKRSEAKRYHEHLIGDYFVNENPQGSPRYLPGPELEHDQVKLPDLEKNQGLSISQDKLDNVRKALNERKGKD